MAHPAAPEPPSRTPSIVPSDPAAPLAVPSIGPSSAAREMVDASAAASAIIVAVGGDLLWAPLAGRPLLAWTVDAFARAAAIDEIALVVAAERLLEARALAAAQNCGKLRIAVSGDTRLCAFLRVGLAALGEQSALVVVHEGARPLVTPELISAGIAVAWRTGAAVAAVPVKETIKRVRGGVVAGTEPRERLVRAQTPQVFARALLLDALAALARADPALDCTDAAMLALGAGVPVVMYPGSPENLRVATREDLALAETLLQRTSGG
jgi:2-C-methyl-D-erythritol 4-phosphate cytidylyltransferase